MIELEETTAESMKIGVDLVPLVEHLFPPVEIHVHP